MGLLDEAIREHLELKRRSGADPSEVAREEREVLTPVSPDEHAEPHGEVPKTVQDGTEREEIVEAHTVLGEDPRQSGALGADVSAVGQETAELDMQAVLEEDPDAAESPVGPVASGPAPATPGLTTPAEGSLEWWGDSGEPDDHHQHETPGQERLSFE
jgi:hypothetical protein